MTSVARREISFSTLNCIRWPLTKSFEVVAGKVAQIAEPAGKCCFRY